MGQVYQLHGGIHKYIEQFPDGHFRGKNYVFDLRQSIAANGDVLSTCRFCFTPHDVYITCSSQGTALLSFDQPILEWSITLLVQIATSCCLPARTARKRGKARSTAVRNASRWDPSGTRPSRRPRHGQAAPNEGDDAWKRGRPTSPRDTDRPNRDSLRGHRMVSIQVTPTVNLCWACSAVGQMRMMVYSNKRRKALRLVTRYSPALRQARRIRQEKKNGTTSHAHHKHASSSNCPLQHVWAGRLGGQRAGGARGATTGPAGLLHSPAGPHTACAHGATHSCPRLLRADGPLLRPRRGAHQRVQPTRYPPQSCF